MCSVCHTRHADTPLAPVNGEAAICPLFRGKADLAYVDSQRNKESPERRVRGFQEVSQPSRDQGALDAGDIILVRQGAELLSRYGSGAHRPAAGVAHWQRAAELLLAQADVADLSKWMSLRAFYDAKLDLAAR